MRSLSTGSGAQHYDPESPCQKWRTGPARETGRGLPCLIADPCGQGVNQFTPKQQNSVLGSETRYPKGIGPPVSEQRPYGVFARYAHSSLGEYYRTMTPTWYLVKCDYTPVAEIKFRDEHFEALPQVIWLDGVKYTLDRSGGFYHKDTTTDPPVTQGG